MTEREQLIADCGDSIKDNKRVLISTFELLGLHARIEYLEGQLGIERKNNLKFAELVMRSVK